MSIEIAKDSRGTAIEPGDYIAYAVRVYNSARLRQGTVRSVTEKESPYSWRKKYFSVTVEPLSGGRAVAITHLDRAIVITKKART